jgi:hypothetical protein
MSNDDKHPAQVYLDTLQEVGRIFMERAPAEGDPELFGATFAGLLESYLGPVLSIRRLAAVDAFVVMSLVEAAKVVSGGPQAQRFRDMMAAALAGSVHVERVVAEATARKAAQEPPERPGNAPGGVSVDLTKEEPKAPPARDPGPVEREAERSALAQEPDPLAGVASAADAIRRDEERAEDADLLRWVLDPGSDPWADLLEDRPPRIGDHEPKRPLRPGITQEDVQTRSERLHGLLDTRTPPEGVTGTAWRAARMRAMPETFADLPPA